MMLLSGVKTPTPFWRRRHFRQLKKALMERGSGVSRRTISAADSYVVLPRFRGNSRNGHSAKTVLTDDGSVDLSILRDRASTGLSLVLVLGGDRLMASTARSSVSCP